jgi:hypothetical protein
MTRRFQRRELLALLSILLFDSFLLYAHALSDFDCHISVNDAKFDLTSLAGEHVINRTRSTPPTTMLDSLRFDLCADLKTIEGLDEHDQVRLPNTREPDVCWFLQCTDVDAFPPVFTRHKGMSNEGQSKGQGTRSHNSSYSNCPNEQPGIEFVSQSQYVITCARRLPTVDLINYTRPKILISSITWFELFGILNTTIAEFDSSL